MKKRTMLVVAPVREAHLAQLQDAAPDWHIFHCRQKDLTPAELAGAEVIFGNLAPARLQEATSLKWIQLNSAGADPYCVPGVFAKPALLSNAVGAYGLTVSEHMLTMLLCAYRRFPEYLRLQQAHNWQPSGEVRSVEGSVLLIVGMGDIGSDFARKTQALGAYNIGIRRSLRATTPPMFEEQHTLEDLDALLPRADAVVLVVPASPETHHMLDARRLALMQPHALVLNVGRGPLIDTDALVDALTNQTIGGACLDVTDPEPLPADHPLWGMENVLITPHVAGNFHLPATLDRVVTIAANNLRRYIAGEQLHNLVPLP